MISHDGIFCRSRWSGAAMTASTAESAKPILEPGCAQRRRLRSGPQAMWPARPRTQTSSIRRGRAPKGLLAVARPARVSFRAALDGSSPPLQLLTVQMHGR